MQAIMTEHAAVRAAQRNISKRDIEIIAMYGRELHCGGVLHLFLGEKDLPADLRSDDAIARLIGMTAVLAKDDHSIITIYRNRDALSMIRRKSKWDLSRRGRRMHYAA